MLNPILKYLQLFGNYYNTWLKLLMKGAKTNIVAMKTALYWVICRIISWKKCNDKFSYIHCSSSVRHKNIALWNCSFCSHRRWCRLWNKRVFNKESAIYLAGANDALEVNFFKYKKSAEPYKFWLFCSARTMFFRLRKIEKKYRNINCVT